MKKFTYKNYKTTEVVFECVAESIGDADKAYEKHIGVNPIKQNYIGCSFKPYE